MAKHLLRLRKRRAFLQRSPMWHIAIYPALAWAPIFGTSATLPAQPSPSGSTSSSLNGLFAARPRFEKGKWSAETMFMWAAHSAEGHNPLVEVDRGLGFG